MSPFQLWELTKYGNILPEPFSEQMPEDSFEETEQDEIFTEWMNEEANDFLTEQEF